MARYTLEEFDSSNPTLVYIAGNIIEAEKAELALAESGIDYALNIEAFTGTSLFSGVRQGLFVYVDKDSAGKSRTCLEEHGLTDTIDLKDLDDE